MSLIGLGKWETVSVRIVDDAQEEEVAAAREKEVSSPALLSCLFAILFH
jgi:hypothetical protein